MTPELWGELVAAAVALMAAAASWLHSKTNRTRIEQLEVWTGKTVRTGDRTGKGRAPGDDPR